MGDTQLTVGYGIVGQSCRWGQGNYGNELVEREDGWKQAGRADWRGLAKLFQHTICVGKILKGADMSILIKDEKMPNNCGKCWLIYSGTDVNGKPEYECVLTEEKRACEELFSKRGKYCPLVEIPPHGRLIDADRLADDLEQDAWSLDDDDIRGRELNLNAAAWLRSSNAPTVIESEEE